MSNNSKAASTNKAEVAKLVRDLNPAAKKCKRAFETAEKATTTVKEEILANADKLTLLLSKFCVTAGQAGKTLDIEDNLINREEYVRSYWGVTVQHMLQTLGLSKKSTGGKSKKKETDIRKTAGFKLGREEGVKAAENPDYAEIVKKETHHRDERRLNLIHDSFANTQFAHSFAYSLNALLNAIETPGKLTPSEILDLSRTVRVKFTDASAMAKRAMTSPEEFVDIDPRFHLPTKRELAATKKTANPKCSVHDCKKPAFGTHRPEHNVTINGKCAAHGGSEMPINAGLEAKRLGRPTTNAITPEEKDAFPSPPGKQVSVKAAAKAASDLKAATANADLTEVKSTVANLNGDPFLVALIEDATDDYKYGVFASTHHAPFLNEKAAHKYTTLEAAQASKCEADELHKAKAAHAA